VMNMALQSQLKKYDLKKVEDATKYETFINEKLESISEFVQVLSRTIDDFRNFFKDNKDTVISDINKPIKKALKIIIASINAEGITLHESYESKLESSLHYSELMQVFLNLLKNSQDNFIEKNIKDPKIWIKTYDLEDMIVVDIIDNGGGIKENNLDEIFEAYYSTKGKNGTGLGLYMSKIIIEEHHNGKLTVENEDDGISFTIKIPKTWLKVY